MNKSGNKGIQIGMVLLITLIVAGISLIILVVAGVKLQEILVASGKGFLSFINEKFGFGAIKRIIDAFIGGFS